MRTKLGRAFGALALASPLAALQADSEESAYGIIDMPTDAGQILEVGGIALLPDGRPLISTRRGEVFLIDNAYGKEDGGPRYLRWAHGLQEPLGLLVHEGWVYCAQRGELSRMRDTDGDDRMDELETVCDTWRISGNYHEYNFGPRIDHEGNFWITTNKPFGGEPFGRVDWRGYALRITPEGEMLPTCCGLRSPAGVEVAPWGDVFYTDNQGEWCGASKLSHLEPGDFHGHPWGTFSTELPGWTYERPTKPPARRLMSIVEEDCPTFKLPAVWFPYDKMGKSPAGILWDQSEGGFGPFAGQAFVGDQHHSAILRVFLEEVDGHWQGACFPFRSGFQSGVLRMAWGADGSMLVGMTNRGWGSRGSTTEGMQRLVFTGSAPFEIHELSARHDGFEMSFTAPVDPSSVVAGDIGLSSYTYELHADYGSAEMDVQQLSVSSAVLSADGLSLRLGIEGLRAGYVHEFHMDGVAAVDGRDLLHTEAYYTLAKIPTDPDAPAEEPDAGGR